MITDVLRRQPKADAEFQKPLVDIETEVTELVSQLPRRTEAAQVTQLPRRNEVLQVKLEPLPDYVDHIDQVPRVGALSAEAVVRDYEETAKHIESLGQDLNKMAAKCEDMAKNVLGAVEDINRTAARYREEARKAFKRIEECAIMTENVRKTCAQMREKIEENGKPV